MMRFRLRPFLLTLLLGIILTAASARAADINWTHAKTITIVMADYTFTPPLVQLKRGQPYRLHFVNQGKELHEFTAAQFFATATIGNPDVVTREGTEVEVEPAAEKDVLVVPNQSGLFGYTCGDHEAFGMKAAFAVE